MRYVKGALRYATVAAFLFLAYAFVTDAVAFHAAQFRLERAQAQALMLIADELHGTHL